MGASFLHPDEQLRRELLSDRLSNKSAGIEQHAYEVAFRHWFGLGPQPARLLVLLYLGAGEPLTTALLATALRTTIDGVQRHICDIRKSLDAEAIDSARLCYRLTDDGLAECRAVLWQVGETLRKAV